MIRPEKYVQPDWLDRLTDADFASRERAYHALMDEWHQPIYRFLRTLLGSHADAADATQNTFIQVLESVHGFRREAQFSTWLFAIARRKGLDALRKRTRSIELEFNEEFQDRLLALQSDVLFDGNEAEAHLHAAVLALPERQREIFVLRYFQELPYQAISEILQLSEGAVKASYFHAKEKVRSRAMQELNALR